MQSFKFNRKNVILLKRMFCKVKEENPEFVVIFLRCVVHQVAHCKFVLRLDHVVKPVVKLINMIRAKEFNHRQLIKFHEKLDADYPVDLFYHCSICWLSLSKSCQRLWDLKEVIDSFLVIIDKANNFLEVKNRD